MWVGGTPEGITIHFDINVFWVIHLYSYLLILLSYFTVYREREGEREREREKYVYIYRDIYIYTYR